MNSREVATSSLHWLRVGNHQRRQCVRLKRLIIEVRLFKADAVETLKPVAPVSQLYC
nr:hypothetical protein [uncultured Tolumonas sp.]